MSNLAPRNVGASSSTRLRVVAFSVTPSPYQRDLFLQLSKVDQLDLAVFYFELAPDDSPWAGTSLNTWEAVLPGKVFGKGRVRCHVNTHLPELDHFDAAILNAPLTAATTQRLMRTLSARGIPWVFWAELLLPRSGWRGTVQRLLASPLKWAGAIAAIGSRAASDYRTRFPQTPVYQLPYACDIEPFRAAAAGRGKKAAESNSCRFLFAGQMIPRKGVDVLLDAFADLVASGLDVYLTLVGREADLPGFLDKLSASAVARIEYLGFLQPPELPPVFAAADVFVLPSRHDGWGVVVNQALGAGLPVITTTAAGAGFDLVDPGNTGVHVPPGEREALAAAMKSLADDPTTRKTMSVHAFEKAESIAPAAIAKRWHELLQKLTR